MKKEFKEKIAELNLNPENDEELNKKLYAIWCEARINLIEAIKDIESTELTEIYKELEKII